MTAKALTQSEWEPLQKPLLNLQRLAQSTADYWEQYARHMEECYEACSEEEERAVSWDSSEVEEITEEAVNAVAYWHPEPEKRQGPLYQHGFDTQAEHLINLWRCYRDFDIEQYALHNSFPAAFRQARDKAAALQLYTEALLRDLTPEAGKTTEQGAKLPETNPDEEAKESPVGVTLHDAALIICMDDPSGLQDTKRSWHNSRKHKLPPSIGKCPYDSRRNLYEPSALLSFLKKFYGPSVVSECDLSASLYGLKRLPASIRG